MQAIQYCLADIQYFLVKIYSFLKFLLFLIGTAEVVIALCHFAMVLSEFVHFYLQGLFEIGYCSVKVPKIIIQYSDFIIRWQ